MLSQILGFYKFFIDDNGFDRKIAVFHSLKKLSFVLRLSLQNLNSWCMPKLLRSSAIFHPPPERFPHQETLPGPE